MIGFQKFQTWSHKSFESAVSVGGLNCCLHNRHILTRPKKFHSSASRDGNRETIISLETAAIVSTPANCLSSPVTIPLHWMMSRTCSIVWTHRVDASTGWKRSKVWPCFTRWQPVPRATQQSSSSIKSGKFLQLSNSICSWRLYFYFCCSVIRYLLVRLPTIKLHKVIAALELTWAFLNLL